MLVTTRHWMAYINGSGRIVIQQKQEAELTEDLFAELDLMRKLCFPDYDLHIEATPKGIIYRFQKIHQCEAALPARRSK